VTGDTRIYTNRGLVKARELFDNETEIEVAIDGRFGLTNATTPSTRVFRTGVKPVFRLQTEEGYFVRATADHRFMTPSGWRQLNQLQAGDKIHIMNRKGGFGSEGSLELGRVLGWLVGDGTVKSDEAVLSFFGAEKQELAPIFAEHVNALVKPLTKNQNRTYTVGIGQVIERDEARVSSARLRQIAEQYGLAETKHQVPEAVFQGSEEMQRGFLQALFTADGSFQDGGSKGASVRLAANQIELLEGVQQLLGNFGVVSRIYRNRREAGYRMMPDSNREAKAYWCEAQHELVISKQNMSVFADEIGFMMDYKQAGLEDYISRGKRGPYGERFVATVESIESDGIEEVFDLTESVTHSFIANSFVVHNCGEQGLPAFGVCNLGAINLAKFYDESAHDVNWEDLDKTARYATRFLDNVIDSTPYFFDENKKQQMSERRVGLNNMGLAELMVKLQIRYGSDESVAFIDKLYGFLARSIYETSIDLAQEKGAFPKFRADQFLKSGFMQAMPKDIQEKVRKNGIRNVTLTTQAPTGTTGTMVNTSTGIEPFFSWVYYRKSRLGLHEEQVPLVKEWYDAHPGETELPDYFVTAMDLSPEEHIKVQAAIQRWVDSSISKTCNVPNEYTVEQVSDLYKYMYELGCKGGTIYRDGSRDEQVLMLKGDERAESEMSKIKGEEKAAPAPKVEEKPVEQVATPHRVYPRPKRLSGVTVSRKTPFGTAFITMNSDDLGNPFEVFITIGKAGSDLQADAEGLGRMLSLQLRTTAPQNRMEMLKLIVEQLQGIGGSRSVGMGPQRVISLPDAVAGALVEHYLTQNEPQQLNLPMGNDSGAKPQPSQTSANWQAVELNGDGHVHTNGHGHVTSTGYKVRADICPSCGTVSLIRIEGCEKCDVCGYSRC
jgi:ribonucleoside-diphosphate reductase alpha chain